MHAASETHHITKVLGHLFRHEAGRMAAVLTRYLGSENFEVAEDIVQDTLLKAMETWPFYGMPQNPSAWLYKVAKNKAIDFIRNHQIKQKAELSIGQKGDYDFQLTFDEEVIKDSVLRMMFTCCHPSIPPESQIALTLKTLGGLSTQEIARAFLTNEETIAKRIYRAKAKIREEQIKLEPPRLFDLPFRLNSVLKVLYLIFNEGYYATDGDKIIREELCEDAMRLTYLLVQHPVTALPKAKALIALMCFHTSRINARTNEVGELILLEHQDRKVWSQPLIQKGLSFLEAAACGDEVSEYHLEAAIASIHSLAPRFADTKWDKLVVLYEKLYAINPSDTVALNTAIAVGYADSPSKGLTELLKLKSLENHHLYQCAVGNFHFLLQQPEIALMHFKRAFNLASSDHEKLLITKRINTCEESLRNS